MKKIFLAFLVCSNVCLAQFAPDADTEGTTAIDMNSDSFVAWANNAEITRGYLNISDKSFEIDGSNKASFGEVGNALGEANGNASDVVSLGDSGVVVLTFNAPIVNGDGFDFAVFENSFSNEFLEFAFVEVSSNGIDFVRFPSYSHTPTSNQTNGFGNTDPTKIRNLAGKYRSGYGTPFDLEELIDSANVDVNNITHVKIIDVVGSVDANFGTKDARDTLINDPFPTPFESGGFDLDAVGVIHTADLGMEEFDFEVSLYPNPVQDLLHIKSSEKKI